MKLILTGGRQRRLQGLFGRVMEWHKFDQARLVELDTTSGDATVRLEYTTPPELCPDFEPSIVFKAGFASGDRLGVVTQTEVLVLDRATYEILEHRSHPLFNDNHHVGWIEGKLHVVSTGLDSLIVLDSDGQLEAVHHALGPDHLSEIDSDVDYRLVSTTKPHASHPNFVFETSDGVWMTRSRQGDAALVADPSQRIELGPPGVHDGIVRDDGLWFTRVQGYLVRTDPGSRQVLETLDIQAAVGSAQPLGWCRGLHIDEGVAYIGFSRLRRTAIRENLAWIKARTLRRTFRNRPTRVMALDIAAMRNGDDCLLGEWSLEPSGINAVFSVLPAA